MPEKSKGTNNPKGSKPRQAGAEAPKATPDRWVDDKLRQLYDDIAAEPLPQDLLDLLNKIDLDDPSRGGK
ncbi:hypothetical protein D3874_17355 [Oleomonas cavernae]|uniref:Anti-sigma factor NepR domain-containing protein n=1 Tax=Oleomonas cavernae TaxID=2320859 RepID=A0A418WEY2_9PROT|nr:NepR family anti-sigma factor [Oleomonas cavernae]RJF88554.1 hypothetical protein D3874_17355 [Oleomonas cavernae]